MQRLIRVLVYEGDPIWIQDCLACRGIKGSMTFPRGCIKEAVIGDFLQEILGEGESADAQRP